MNPRGVEVPGVLGRAASAVRTGRVPMALGTAACGYDSALSEAASPEKDRKIRMGKGMKHGYIHNLA